MGELETWKHCPRCGSALEHMEGSTKVECPQCTFRHYAHSQVTACAIVIDDRGRVLLARRSGPPYQGAWDLPGGFVGEAEHPRDAVRRELREETGLEIEPHALIGIWMDRYSEDGRAGPSTMNLYYTASVVGSGNGEAADDVAELRWVKPDDFPKKHEFAFHIGDVLDVWRNENP